MRNSTFSGNTIGAGAGSSISNINRASLIVIDSSFTGDRAGDRGGIQNVYRPLTVNNSTFFGDRAVASGGGISSYPGGLTGQQRHVLRRQRNRTHRHRRTVSLLEARGTVFNSTFSGNGTARRSSISNSAFGRSVLNFANNIVANSTAGGITSNTGTIGTNHNDLIEDGSCSTDGMRSQNSDPQLGALADNSSPTRTFRAAIESPAVDASNNTTCAAAPVSGEDQHGESRNDASCDIRTFELNETAPPWPRQTAPANVPEGGSVTLDGTGSERDPDSGDTLTYAWNLDGDSIYGEAGADAARGSNRRHAHVRAGPALDRPDSITVSLRVTDQGGLSSTDTATVNITNVAPTVGPPTVAPKEPSAEGSAATTGRPSANPGTRIPHLHGGLRAIDQAAQPSAIVDTPAPGSSSRLRRQWTYPVVVTVTDKNGGTGEQEQPPGRQCRTDSRHADSDAGAVGGRQSGDHQRDLQAIQGASIPSPARSTRRPDRHPAWHGQWEQVQRPQVHVYADNRTNPVVVAVTDKDGGTGSKSTNHLVDNVAPAITELSLDATAIPEDGTVALAGKFSDPGASDNYQVTISGAMEARTQ